ncbi:histidine kinase dimerization/phospho-acceptor domain-containing protein [Variovorax rhizosphaerae]|uniref:sensor histidine kinase n=1 Tax=Variovorax rhizosphaerae TaxID=1836200 RepID=UPI003BF5A9A3
MVSYSERVANSRDTFLAVLGHDLRNPLSALGSCVQLLAVSGEPASRDRSIRIARQSLASMNGMITDLLEYARSRLGRGIDVSPAVGDLAALCRETFDEVSAAYPTRTLSAEIPEKVSVEFDAPRTRQVLTNLLGNAVQHGDPAFPVSLVLQTDVHDVTFIVRNMGTPIPPEAMQVIFNPLVQVANGESAPHERPTTSLGLGPLHRAGNRGQTWWPNFGDLVLERRHCFHRAIAIGCGARRLLRAFARDRRPWPWPWGCACMPTCVLIRPPFAPGPADRG